ncbi:hypothetical protein NGF19_13985 [Streptomyces sp. RY43-2]|uniref:Uncharacterized protein n=1 Tax=Streptomyces macrolidinus TaxID=2952607 RepID=A0ABT0ZE91_9ACTN|nr:hypothetical protein [Streptomyces macrolidinus]MCN9241888.1 hypothetical protein [Streptomyces macrolidinus]
MASASFRAAPGNGLADGVCGFCGVLPGLFAGQVQQTAADGTLLADRPDSPPLTILRTWLAAWEDAGRPAPEAYSPELVRSEGVGETGWRLRLAVHGFQTDEYRLPTRR